MLMAYKLGTGCVRQYGLPANEVLWTSSYYHSQR